MKKNQKYALAGILLIFTLVGIWRYFAPARHPKLPVAEIPDRPAVNRVKTPAGASNETGAVVSKRTNAPKNTSSADRAELWRTAAQELNVPINFWGKVVDQDNRPLSGAKVRLSVRKWGVQRFSPYESTSGTHELETGQNGRFEVLNETGDILTIESIQKEGYQASSKGLRSFGYNISTNHTPEPNNPVVFKMWKTGVPEPLLSHHFSRIGIPCDGTPVFFDVMTGERKADQGDLVITLARTPVNLPSRRAKYDWVATLGVPNGGLVESDGELMYLAPENGYQPAVTFKMGKDAPNWTPLLKKQFYIRMRNGTAYGRINVQLSTDFQPPPTGLIMDVTINPSGSRNLEPGAKLKVVPKIYE